MSTTKCPHCQEKGFEAVEEDVKDYSFKLFAIRCKHCKTAITVIEHKNTAVQLQKILKYLKIE